MDKKAFEKTVLKQLERISRKNAVGDYPYPEPPICTFILHQPKRPERKTKE